MSNPITVTVSEPRKRKVEVTLPVYRRHDLCCDPGSDGPSDVIVYSRIYQTPDGKLRCLDVQVTVETDWDDNPRRTVYELEIEHDYRFDGSEEDYLLGKGRFACTPERFEEVLAEAHALAGQLLDEVRR